MKLLRRQFLNMAGAAAALPAVSRIAHAQVWPSKTIRQVRAARPMSFRESFSIRRRFSLVNQSLLRTGLAPEALSGPTRSPRPNRMAIPS
jgi:hypothetical protein